MNRSLASLVKQLVDRRTALSNRKRTRFLCLCVVPHMRNERTRVWAGPKSK